MPNDNLLQPEQKVEQPQTAKFHNLNANWSTRTLVNFYLKSTHTYYWSTHTSVNFYSSQLIPCLGSVYFGNFKYLGSFHSIWHTWVLALRQTKVAYTTLDPHHSAIDTYLASVSQVLNWTNLGGHTWRQSKSKQSCFILVCNL